MFQPTSRRAALARAAVTLLAATHAATPSAAPGGARIEQITGLELTK